MEFNFPPISLLLASLVFIFLVSKQVRKTKPNISISRLPPGPRKLPLIGNIHNLFGPLPHHTLKNLAGKYGPLMHLKLGEVCTVVISSPETAKQALKDHDIIFSNRPFLLAAKVLSYNSTNIGSSPYGDYWRQMRKICVTELLGLKRVQTFQFIRAEEVSNMIRSISSEKKGPVNLSKKIFSLTFGITSRAAFGKKSKNQEEFISIMKEIVVVAAGFSVADMFPSVKVLEVMSGMRRRLEKMQKRTDSILKDVLDEHRSNMGRAETEDLVDVLLRVQKQGDLEFPITDDNIKAVILDIFTAGSETSSTVLEWAMSELLKNPTAMQRAQAEVRRAFTQKGHVDEMEIHQLKYLNSVIKETLRLHPSAPLLAPRENSEECKIDGFQIPSKSKIIVNAWAIGRDPKHWVEAERFNPERFLDSGIDFRGRDFEYIPFGAGRRICPGISFGVANVEFPLAQLLYHFDWKLPEGIKSEELDMEEAFGLTVRRKNDLILNPIPYDPSQEQNVGC